MIQQEQDWLMRQVQMLVQFVARILFGVDNFLDKMDEVQASEMGELYVHVNKLLLGGNICDAEDSLYESFNESKDYLRLALWFYSELNKMTDENLGSSDFSREEVYDGLRDILSRGGIPFPTIV
ncbi:MAG: DUF6483 family protein [Defluviitaleaceae bacterium]|nr:DUF6483 family protein [Defluviitaleaceae bacterium]